MPITEDEIVRIREIRERNRKTYHSWKLTPEQKEELVKRYGSGETTKELAERFGVHPVTVVYHIDRATGAR